MKKANKVRYKWNKKKFFKNILKLVLYIGIMFFTMFLMVYVFLYMPIVNW